MSKILLIAKQELAYFFKAPLAWTILGVVLAITAWIFLAQVEHFQQIAHELMNMAKSPGVTGFVITPLYSTISIILLMLVPILVMNSIHRERWNGNMLLLDSAPLSYTHIVLGKFLGLSIFLAILVLLITLMPMSLLMAAPIDLRVVAMNALGLWLLLCTFAAITLFIASVSKEPIITLCLSIGVLLLLWLLDVGAGSQLADQSAVSYLSSVQHFENFLKARLNTADLLYFILLIVLFLALAIRHLNYRRERV